MKILHEYNTSDTEANHLDLHLSIPLASADV